MKRHARTLPLFITMVAMLAFAAPGYGALAKPTVTAPTNGASYNTLPHFSWNPVTGADHYEFQIAADAAFTSSVLGFGQDDFITKNTTATVLKTLPNGTYRAKPEFADVQRVALATGRPLQDIFRLAAAEAERHSKA